MIAAARSTVACACRSRGREGRCVDSRALLRPDSRGTTGKERMSPYPFLAGRQLTPGAYSGQTVTESASIAEGLN